MKLLARVIVNHRLYCLCGVTFHVHDLPLKLGVLLEQLLILTFQVLKLSLVDHEVIQNIFIFHLRILKLFDCNVELFYMLIHDPDVFDVLDGIFGLLVAIRLQVEVLLKHKAKLLVVCDEGNTIFLELLLRNGWKLLLRIYEYLFEFFI